MPHKPPTSPAFLEKAEGLACVRSVDPHRVVLLSPSSDQPVILSGTSAAIWAILNDVLTTQEVVERIAHEYRVDPSEVSSDVEQFIENLVDQQLLVTRAPGRQ
ncbi:PqqD family protein [Arthrobacter sp. AOP36-C1-22]|uniref:PqqD family protein n=1 Tax=Arthrobacter sp. AOP36-C1-22 TaxID=3457683 RepID=UPI0040335097